MCYVSVGWTYLSSYTKQTKHVKPFRFAYLLLHAEAEVGFVLGRQRGEVHLLLVVVLDVDRLVGG